MKRIAGISVAVMVTICLFAFLLLRYGKTPTFLSPGHKYKANGNMAANSAYNARLVDSGVALLRSGYIVLRMGQGADSYLLARLNKQDKSYSHCGIVMVEHGYPFVYHSIGGEDNPDERLRRDSASFFFSPLHNFAIAIARYDMDSAGVNELRNVVYDYYRKRPLFDLKFDMATDDKLYCAEFVYKALNKATKDPRYIGLTTLMGHTFAGVDNLFINPHASMVWRATFK